MHNSTIRKELQLKGVIPGNEEQLRQWRYEAENKKTYAKMIYNKKLEAKAYLYPLENVVRGEGGIALTADELKQKIRGNTDEKL